MAGLAIANRVASAFGGGGSAGTIQNFTPTNQLTTINGLQSDTRRIGKIAKLPGLEQCNESWALKEKNRLEKMKAYVAMAKKGAGYKKGQMDQVVEHVRTQLEVRQHGMQKAVELASLAAQHRVQGLQMGFGINEQKETVSAWDHVMNTSSGIVNF